MRAITRRWADSALSGSVWESERQGMLHCLMPSSSWLTCRCGCGRRLLVSAGDWLMRPFMYLRGGGEEWKGGSTRTHSRRCDMVSAISLRRCSSRREILDGSPRSSASSAACKKHASRVTRTLCLKNMKCCAPPAGSATAAARWCSSLQPRASGARRPATREQHQATQRNKELTQKSVAVSCAIQSPSHTYMPTYASQLPPPSHMHLRTAGGGIRRAVAHVGLNGLCGVLLGRGDGRFEWRRLAWSVELHCTRSAS